MRLSHLPAILLNLVFVGAVAQAPAKTVKNVADADPALSSIFDSAATLKRHSLSACNCIDSVYRESGKKQAQMDGIAACIENETVVYQSTVKLMSVLMKGSPNNKIEIAIDAKSNEYKRYYYQIERWLKDSCAVMNKAIATNDDAGEKSYSSDPDARKAYTDGVGVMAKEEYDNAIPFFQKAVKIDPVFAFAWDNLGICYRRTGKYPQAEAAYRESLKVDPKGRTALQNLPIALLFQKKYEEAIAAYKDILTHYPNDAEVYYGIGNLYTAHLHDYEKGLDNLCKAYNLYVEQKSPYRTDAEKLINTVYAAMKKENKEETFFKILKENHIKSN